MNPEFRQTLNTFSHNLESANQAAQENIYTFTQLYVDPCLSGLKSCLEDCTAPCFSSRDDNLRRRRGRGRSRGRAENFFDFYDDWEDEEEAATNTLAWGDDELDSLLAGSKSPSQQQPRQQRAMSYGSRGRRMGPVHSEGEQDPTIIPGSSYLGFLERLPWRIGARVLRYKPSAANLQENPGGLKMSDAESHHLLGEDDRSPRPQIAHGRRRSGTQTSQSTTNSLSSRGDLIMSDEDDDAVPLDDEFTDMLGRRTTNVTLDDRSSGNTGSSGKRPGPSRRSTRTASSKSSKNQRSSSQKSLTSLLSPAVEQVDAPSMQELRKEEDQARKEEEMEIEQKREAAQRLAAFRGLSSTDSQAATTEVKPESNEDGSETPSMIEITSPRPMSPDPLSQSRTEYSQLPNQSDSITDSTRPDPP